MQTVNKQNSGNISSILRSLEIFFQLRCRRISNLLQYLSVYPLQEARIRQTKQKFLTLATGRRVAVGMEMGCE